MENQNQSEYNQEGQLSKKERREIKNLEEEKLLASYTRRMKMRKAMKIAVISVAVIVFGSVLTWLAFRGTSEMPGEEVSIQPNEIINPGDPMPGIYLTNPPVSGWHYNETASWGVHEEEIKDQIAISNLEEGGVWITYNPDSPPEVVDSLKSITEKYKDKVILSPRSANDSLIALAAWGRLDKFNYFDEARIVKFIKAYEGKK